MESACRPHRRGDIHEQRLHIFRATRISAPRRCWRCGQAALGYPQCPGEEDEEDGSGCDCCDDLLAALGRIEDKLDPGEYENPEGQADARGYAEENVRSEFNSFKGEVDDKELLPEFDLALPDVGQHGSYYCQYLIFQFKTWPAAK